jgi:predicted nucleic acid-binding protein
MVYVDTSVLAALFLQEPHSHAVTRWYAKARGEMVSSIWCVTEFASALGTKQRTGQSDRSEAESAWEQFGKLAATDLRLLPIEPLHFHRATALARRPASALHAGDALHLACAEHSGAKTIATLDVLMERNARLLHLKPVRFA